MTLPQPRPFPESATQPEPPATSAPPRAASGLLRTFTALHQRNFRLYWFGQLISLLGTWMQSIGQAWLVLRLTHSGWQLGVVGALQALPILLFSIFAGVLADHWPKRHVVLLTQIAAMLQAAALWALVASNTIQLWQLYILALLLGITSCLGRPASRAFLVELVGRDELPNAAALSSSLSSLARVVGPGLGGVIIATGGVATLFLLNAISFIPVVIALALISPHTLHAQAPHTAGARRTTWHSLREGLAYIWHTPAVLLVMVVVGLVLLFGSNFNVVLPLFATDVLRIGATGFGFLSAATGIGALLAGLWMAWSNQRPTIRRLLFVMLIFGLLEVAFALSRLYPLSLLLIASVGFTEEAFAVASMTALQIFAPDHLSGRVMSVQVLFFDGSLPLGYILMGWLSGLYGAPIALLIGALLSLLVVAIGWLWWQSAARVGTELSPVSHAS